MASCPFVMAVTSIQKRMHVSIASANGGLVTFFHLDIKNEDYLVKRLHLEDVHRYQYIHTHWGKDS